MNTKELYSIREWAPLTNVIDLIPSRIQRGLFPANLNITCVGAVEEFLALGSDAGIIFWYNRQTGALQKLKAETTTRITCVSIVNSVEYMVAGGNASGQVSVFQIQKELPPDLNLVAPCTRLKPIERYTIRDLHRNAITCCEWSKNGMKLFSGDRQGVVVLTEFDYQSHISRSVEILSEAYEIVQLSAYQGYLLVSTLYRSIVCQRKSDTLSDAAWTITQIGKKDRKQLVDCGGIFLKYGSDRRPRLICARPNLRFWIADIEGNVEKTLLFREAIVRSPTWEIPILNPKTAFLKRFVSSTACEESSAICDSRNFRNLYVYAEQDHLIVTHDESTLYLLNLERLCVEAVARGFRKILDFCVHNKEIFVLEGERSLLRLAPMPEKPNKKAKIIYNPSFPPPIPVLGTAECGTFESPVEYEPEEEPVINAEECFELPPIEAANLTIPIELAVESSRAEQNRRLEIFKEISKLDFDQSILHHSGIIMKNGRKKRRKSHEPSHVVPKTEGIVEIGHVADSGADSGEFMEPKKLPQTSKSMQMDASFCSNSLEESQTSMATTSGLKKSLSQQLPDPSSPNTFRQTLGKKTKSLVEELNAPPTFRDDEEFPASETYSSKQSKSTVSSGKSPLSSAYPAANQVENASVQTTPREKIYYIEQQRDHDYSGGQPVDDICHDLKATTLVECKSEEKEMNADSNATRIPPTLQFTAVKPEAEEIDSFLLDFRHARDPLRKSPPPSAHSSNASSDWEFLDN